MIILLLISSFIFISSSSAMNKQAATDRLEAARKKAENLFKKSKAEDAKKLEEKNNVSQEIQQVQEQQKPIEQIPVKQSATKAILSNHKQFSDDWWKELFNCKDCPQNPSQIFNCPKLIAANPQWKEIEDMKDGYVKKMVTQKALTRYYNSSKDTNEDKNSTACGLACALCIGGDPNTRVDRVEGDGPDSHAPHLALHVVSDHRLNKHYALFRLLLEKGVDTEVDCLGAKVNNLVNEDFRPELEAYKNRK